MRVVAAWCEPAQGVAPVCLVAWQHNPPNLSHTTHNMCVLQHIWPAPLPDFQAEQCASMLPPSARQYLHTQLVSATAGYSRTHPTQSP